MGTHKAPERVLGTGMGKDATWQAALEWRTAVQDGHLPFPTDDDDAPERDAETHELVSGCLVPNHGYDGVIHVRGRASGIGVCNVL